MSLENHTDGQDIIEKGAVVLPEMVNSKHDATSYENCSCKRAILDGNALYDAFRRVYKASGFKPATSRYYVNLLTELGDLQAKLQSGDYEYPDTTSFILRERGKTRYITADGITGRIVKSALQEEQLLPSLYPYIIYDSGASLKGRGPTFTRDRLEMQLHDFYREYGDNKGYVLLIDFSKYYDNVRHSELMDRLRKYCQDELALLLVEKVLEKSRVDVSWMTDEEVEAAYYEVFNSLAHDEISKELKTGQKFLHKHVNIGDPVAQVAGIAYPIPLDNFIKIVKGVRRYDRYQDDLTLICRDREFLVDILQDIRRICGELGIFINEKKTRICKLDEYFKVLQVRYRLTETGQVVRRINPKRVTAMRRRMKKQATFLSLEEFDNAYKSWYNNYAKLMSRKQRKNIRELYESLRKEHYPCTQSSCQTGQSLKISNSMAITISRQLSCPIATSPESSIL